MTIPYFLSDFIIRDGIHESMDPKPFTGNIIDSSESFSSQGTNLERLDLPKSGWHFSV